MAHWLSHQAMVLNSAYPDGTYSAVNTQDEIIHQLLTERKALLRQFKTHGIAQPRVEAEQQDLSGSSWAVKKLKRSSAWNT